MPSPLATLLSMLSYKRPRLSRSHEQFINRYIKPLPGAFTDPFDNWHVSIAQPDSQPRVLWSSHTDTVHWQGGIQLVQFSNGTIDLPKGSKSGCLGADDTVGVWLMTEMIHAGIPGHYIFHEGEERGCVGSTALAKHFPDWLEKFDCAIAFDRKGTDEIITHQLGERGSSDAFAWSLATQLGKRYAPSPDGIYTDTAQYHSLIPECCNVSVGYYSQHSSREWIDASHALSLRSTLLTLDPGMLKIERDPSVSKNLYDDWGYPSHWLNGSDNYSPSTAPMVKTVADAFRYGSKPVLGAVKGHGKGSDDDLLYCGSCECFYSETCDCNCELNSELERCEVCGLWPIEGDCLCAERSLWLDPDHEAIQRAVREDMQRRYGTVRA